MLSKQYKMKLLKIGLIQMSMSEDLAWNLKKAAVMILKAVKKGAKVICLPELFRSIYFPQSKKVDKNKYAETIPGESTKVLAKIAKKYQVVLIVPIFEKDSNGRYHNSAVMIDSDGKLLSTYRKIHIPHDPLFYEKDYFEASNSDYKVYKTNYGRLAVLICYDQWFPEAARIVTLQGADIIFYPTAIGYIVGHKNSDGDWHEAWETVMRGHAIANGVYVAAVNRVGTEEKLAFFGQSFVSDSFGKVLKRASSKKEEVVVCTVDLGFNKRIREGWGFFRNRRPETYRLNLKSKRSKGKT